MSLYFIAVDEDGNEYEVCMSAKTADGGGTGGSRSEAYLHTPDGRRVTEIAPGCTYEVAGTPAIRVRVKPSLD
jgi:hypothetical protein